jgi:pimeloyl-ACP methyl ester carboxylesterase
MLFWGPAAVSQPAPAPLPDEAARPYVTAQRMVDVGGRRLNLYCMGSGERTVLFDAGGSDWSVTWALVQPAVAARARACVYDRAGLGYSDPAAGPRTPVALVEDLHRLIATAGLKTPLVLVGHSLGGFNVKLHAALYPDDVAGLVLVDPSEDRAAARTRRMVAERHGALLAARGELLDQAFTTRLMDRYRRCGEAARDQDLDPASDLYRRCSDPVRPRLGPAIADERRRLQVRSGYQTAQASEILNSIYGDERGDPVYEALFRPGVFGRKPVVVLTHGRYDASDPLDAAGQAQFIALHQETARLSAVSHHRVVEGANHNIQIDAPEAIVEAIGTVLELLDKPPAQPAGGRRPRTARRAR